MIGFGELVILACVVLVLFNLKKLPDLARSAGQAARILKSEGKAMKADGNASPPSAPTDSAPTHSAPTDGQSAPHVIQPAPGEVTRGEVIRKAPETHRDPG